MSQQLDRPPVRSVHAQNHLAESGLSASGLTDYRKNDRTVGINVQRNVIHRHKLFTHQHAADTEYLADIFYFQKFFCHVSSPPIPDSGTPQSVPA